MPKEQKNRSSEYHFRMLPGNHVEPPRNASGTFLVGLGILTRQLGAGEALLAGVPARPRARPRADAAAAWLARGLPQTRASVQTAPGRPERRITTLGLPSHGLPTAAPRSLPSLPATRSGGKRNAVSRHHVGSGRSEAVCAEAVCAPAARASPGLGARGFSGKFSGALLRLRGVGHAPSRPARLRGLLRPLGSGPAPARRFCASPALPRGNRRRVPLGLDFRHCERWLPRLRGDLPCGRLAS